MRVCRSCLATIMTADAAACSRCGAPLPPARSSTLPPLGGPAAFRVPTLPPLEPPAPASLPPPSAPPAPAAPPVDPTAPMAWALSLTQVTGTGAEGCHGIPARVPHLDPTGFQLTPFEGFLLSLVDGATVVDDVVSASGLSPQDAAPALNRLKELGLLDFRSAEASPPPAPQTPEPAETPEPTPRVELARVKLERRTLPPDRMASPRDALLLIHDAWIKGDLALARELVLEAWARHPDNASVNRLRQDLEDPARAPQRAAALELLGERAENAAQHASAVTLYQRALAEHERQPGLHYRLGLCVLRAGMGLELAAQHLRRALELQPDLAAADFVLRRLDALRG